MRTKNDIMNTIGTTICGNSGITVGQAMAVTTPVEVALPV
jgi:hypothetical protein